MSLSKSVSFGVIGWTSQGEQTLKHELVEVVSLKNLIVKGSPQVGTEVSMQYKNQLWIGTILSLHGNKGDANASSKVLTPDAQVSVNEDKKTTGEKRKRKANKKLFTDEYVTDHDGSEAMQELESDGHSEGEATLDEATVCEKAKGSSHEGKKAPPTKKHKRPGKKQTPAPTKKNKSPGKKQTPVPTKKRKSIDEKKQELYLLTQKLTDIEDNILLIPSPTGSNSSHSQESDWSEEEEIPLSSGSKGITSGGASGSDSGGPSGSRSGSEGASSNDSGGPSGSGSGNGGASGTASGSGSGLKHPHFGGKTPKAHQPPPRCINYNCKQQKVAKEQEIELLKEEIQQLKEELRTSRERTSENSNANVQLSNQKSGKMSREQGNALGFKELVNGSGVWACPNKVGAAIKDAENKSRKVLASSLLSMFFTNEELMNNSYHDLDKDVTEACVEFVMIAKLGKVEDTKKADIRQALRCKINSMKFRTNKPKYFQEYRKTYTGPKKRKDQVADEDEDNNK